MDKKVISSIELQRLETAGNGDALNESSTAEVHRFGGLVHRDDGPAYIERNSRGDVMMLGYYHSGKLHRVEGPAIESFANINGYRKNHEEWHLNGTLHRESGPACTWWDLDDGSIAAEEWYLNGQRVNSRDYSAEPRPPTKG